MQTEFDHIVPGGGSAGCAVAARLAERPDGIPRGISANTDAPSMTTDLQIGHHVAAAATERLAV